MVGVHLVCVGAVSTETAAAVGQAVERVLGCRTELFPHPLDPAFAFDAKRNQYWSTPILSHLESLAPRPSDRVLGIADVDLFIPILTYVFGEALLDRPPAIISLHRLHPTFYGLPDDPARLLLRAQTEAVHELGHTFGLIHCADYACVMHASRVADEIDLKGPGFCDDCAATLARKVLAPRRGD